MVDFNVNALQERVTTQAQQTAQDVHNAQVTRDQRQRLQAPQASQQAADREKEEARVQEAVDQMNTVSAQMGTDIQFSFQSCGGGQRMVVQVVDPITGDTLRSIPSEEFLAMKEAIANNIGMILNREG